MVFSATSQLSCYLYMGVSTKIALEGMKSSVKYTVFFFFAFVNVSKYIVAHGHGYSCCCGRMHVAVFRNQSKKLLFALSFLFGICFSF